FIGAVGELKTTPTQPSVRELRAIGIQPDILLCRTDRILPSDIKKKIALFCNVSEEAVITAKDVETIYEVPLILAKEGLDAIILKNLDLPYRDKDMTEWIRVVETLKNPSATTDIALVGKYVEYEDSYKSLTEALTHGGLASSCRVNIHWIEAEGMEREALRERLSAMDGILVPGGFGLRGVTGMIHAIRFAREKKFPFFGICLGLQC